MIRRALWRICRLIGLEEFSWNKQHEVGVWRRETISQDTIRFAEELCHGGILVEFGCGDGKLPHALKPGSFSQYFGSDISAVAAQKASDAAQLAGLSNCHFKQCDMSEWQGTSGVSLIIAEECIYYLSPPAAQKFLHTCCNSLSTDGSILAIFHSAEKHAVSIETCRNICRVRKELRIGSRTYLVLSAKSFASHKRPDVSVE